MESNEKPKKIKFIGMRVLKTVIAVYICFSLELVREGVAFFSAIAAILCMQPDNKHSLETGKSRMIGTILGGMFGFLVITIIDFCQIELFSNLHYLILSLFLIPIIYSNVYLKSSTSSYISCVVFLSITVSHGGDSAPMIFAINRVIDTLIGIIVSLIVNNLLSKKVIKRFDKWKTLMYNH